MTTILSGGCIRLYPASHATPGPQWHINEGHATIGLFDTSAPPTIDPAGFLVIKLTNPETGQPNTFPVVTMAANPDETLTARHISGGCSNGGPICRILLTHKDLGPLDLTRADHWALVAGKYCNLWPEARHKVPEPA